MNINDSMAINVLPWPTEVLRKVLFGLEFGDDEITGVISNAVNDILAANEIKELKENASQLRYHLKVVKKESPNEFNDLLTAWRINGFMSETDNIERYSLNL